MHRPTRGSSTASWAATSRPAPYVLRMTPNQVTFVSAIFSYASIAAIALFKPSGLLAAGVTLGLVLGYALDSADGQLARLRGGGSVAGEWLDHMVDCGKIAALHLAGVGVVLTLLPRGQARVAVLAGRVRDRRDRLLLRHDPHRPVASRAGRHRSAAAAPDAHAPLWRSLLVLPTDYGLMCLVFATIAFPKVFMTLYALLFLGTFVFLIAVSVKWYREISAFGRRPAVGSAGLMIMLRRRRARSPGPARVLLAHPSPDLYGSDRMLVESVRSLTEAGCVVTVALPIDGPLVPLLQQAGAGVVIVETLVLRKSLMSPRGLITLLTTGLRSFATRGTSRALCSSLTSST